MECEGTSPAVVQALAGDPCPNFTVCLLELIVTIAVAFLVVSANLLSLVVLARTPLLLNGHGLLIMSLSASDLISGLTGALAVYPSSKLTGAACWPYGSAVCALSAFLGNMATFNSFLSLVLLSLERYIAVLHPLRYSRLVTRRTTLSAVLMTWLFSTASQIPILTGRPGSVYVAELNVCMPRYFEHPVIAAAVLLGFHIPCFAVILLTSLRVRRRLAASARRRELMTNPGAAGRHHQSETGTSAHQPPARRGDRGESRTHKLARMVRLMTLALVVTWLPFLSMCVVAVVRRDIIPHGVIFAVHWLLVCNGFLNSAIYFMMASAFRKACYQMVRSLAPRACLRPGETSADRPTGLPTVTDGRGQVRRHGDIKLQLTTASDVTEAHGPEGDSGKVEGRESEQIQDKAMTGPAEVLN